MATLYEGSTQLILTSVHLHYDRLRSVIVHEGGIEEGLADLGFKALECWIHQGVPVPFGKLFSPKPCFIREAWNKGLKVVDQA